jgi:hypothetical protein
MDAELVKRLKGWFYLRLPAEDWTKFGSSAQQVLQTFDDDPDQETALLRFAIGVILIEAQKLNDPQIMEQRMRELTRLGIDREQLAKVMEAWDGFLPTKSKPRAFENDQPKDNQK